MVKNHSDIKRGNPLPSLHRLLFMISKGSVICTMPPAHIPPPTHTHTQTGVSE